jgi:hypothetical protein
MIMNQKNISFDEVFRIWLDNEVLKVEGRDLLPVAKSKGFNSIAEWRLATALALRMDLKDWTLQVIKDPNRVLPEVVVGPYPGWSKFFHNTLNTTFEQALHINEFWQWCQGHDRIVPLSKNFPLPTTIILLQKENGQLIHVEGGHRICAVAYTQKIGKPIDFTNKPPVTAAVAREPRRKYPVCFCF